MDEPIYLNSSGFDPSLFHDEDGKKYLLNMIWDHRLNKHSFAGISLQEYSVTKEKLMGQPMNIFKGTEIGRTEAPHLYKRNDFYYLLTAEGGTSYSHQASIARSKKITGPYETHPDNPLLTSQFDENNPLQKSGHASFVCTPDHDWYLVHLMGRAIVRNGKSAYATSRNANENKIETKLMNRGYCPLRRETSIQKLEWKEDWPYVVVGHSPALIVEGPNVPEQPWEQDYLTKDDFDLPYLNKHFNTLRVPLSSNIISLNERESHIRLYGKESLTSKFT